MWAGLLTKTYSRKNKNKVTPADLNFLQNFINHNYLKWPKDIQLIHWNRIESAEKHTYF